MTDGNWMDITPGVHYLNAIASQNISAKLALAEWIDNAIDARASSIQIEFGKAAVGGGLYVNVADNGIGTSDLSSLFKIGDHRAHSDRASLGRFGIGAKDAALYFGGAKCLVSVTSTRAGSRRSVKVDFGALLASGKWLVPAPHEDTAEPGDIGTRITVRPVERKIPEGKAWEDLLADLGYMYTPALKRGVQITVRAKTRGAIPAPLSPWRLPDLEPGHINTTITVGNKTARLYAGIVREGVPNDRPGLTYNYKFRVIQPACSRGCGDAPTNRIAGFVELSDAWDLTKNKDAIRGADALYAAVLKEMAPVLARAERVGIELRSTAFALAVAGMLNAAIDASADAKAKRGRGKKSGGAEPTGKGSKHTQAENEQNGATFTSKRQAGKLCVTWDPFGTPSNIGRLTGSAVSLNIENPMVKAAHDSANTLASTVLAMAVLSAEHAIRGVRQLRIPLDDGDDLVEKFTRTMGALMSVGATADGKPIVATEAA